jgi:hypothetical protein
MSRNANVLRRCSVQPPMSVCTDVKHLPVKSGPVTAFAQRVAAATLTMALSLASLISHAGSVDSIFENGFEPVTGVLLQGDPDDLALTALIRFGPIASTSDNIVNDVLLDRVEIILKPESTVGEVNALLAQFNALIVDMREGESLLSLSIPPQTDETALDALAAELSSHSSIQYASRAQQSITLKLPPGPAGDIAHRAELGHLLPTRFPAAWNASRLALEDCETRKVSILVPDTFHPNPPPQWARIYGQVPGFQVIYPNNGKKAYQAVSDTQRDVHGYDVVSVIAGAFDEANPTGTVPFPNCLEIQGLSTRGLSTSASFAEIVDAVRSIASRNGGSVIVNSSIGLGYPACAPSACAPADFARKKTIDVFLASLFLNSISRDRDIWPAALFVQAAGNSRTSGAAGIYPGYAWSSNVSKFAILQQLAMPNQDLDARLSDWLQSPYYWNPSPGHDQFNSLVLDQSEFDAVLALRSRLGIPDRLDRGFPALVVGATSSSPIVSDLIESNYSNIGPDVHAPVDPIFSLSGLDAIGGTSSAAPQVVGLAAYLWLVSPELRAAPIEATMDTITSNFSAGTSSDLRVIDAYASVLATDEATAPTPDTAPVRLAILDLDDDDDFDGSDIALFASRLINVPLPTELTYDRYDLNGDGVTGGEGTSRFDLDRAGSIRFGATLYNVVTQMIEGQITSYDESMLRDIDILCYYAYSALYTGDPLVREAHLRTVCVPPALPDPISTFESMNETVVSNGRILGFTLNSTGQKASRLDLELNQWEPFVDLGVGNHEIFTPPVDTAPDMQHVLAVSRGGRGQLLTRLFDPTSGEWGDVLGIALQAPTGYYYSCWPNIDVHFDDEYISLVFLATLVLDNGSGATRISIFEARYDLNLRHWDVPVLRGFRPWPAPPPPDDGIPLAATKTLKIDSNNNTFLILSGGAGTTNTFRRALQFAPGTVEPVDEYRWEVNAGYLARIRADQMFSNRAGRIGYLFQTVTQSTASAGQTVMEQMFRFDPSTNQWEGPVLEVSEPVDRNPNALTLPVMDERGSILYSGVRRLPTPGLQQAYFGLLRPSSPIPIELARDDCADSSSLRGTFNAEGTAFVANLCVIGSETKMLIWKLERTRNQWILIHSLPTSTAFYGGVDLDAMPDGRLIITYRELVPGSPSRTASVTRFLHQ